MENERAPLSDEPEEPAALNPVDRELAGAIAVRRGISVAAAEDIVR
jgi:hypothetical protein